MARILKYQTFQEFLDYNKEYLLNNYFENYHLIRIVDNLNAGQYDLYDAYNIVDDDSGNILCLFITGSYFIYGQKWTDDMMTVLSQKVDLKKFKNFTFLGNRGLLIQLFEKDGIPYELVKDRLVYECNSIQRGTNKSSGEFEKATVTDFDELVKMCFDNYNEEYSGEGTKGIDDMKHMVSSAITEDALYLWRDNDQICSIVQIINEDNENAMIGNLFTKHALRNNGYAFSLMYALTDFLFESDYRKCGLVSDILNPASNKIFTKIGYTPIAKWGLIFKPN